MGASKLTRVVLARVELEVRVARLARGVWMEIRLSGRRAATGQGRLSGRQAATGQGRSAEVMADTDHIHAALAAPQCQDAGAPRS